MSWPISCGIGEFLAALPVRGEPAPGLAPAILAGPVPHPGPATDISKAQRRKTLGDIYGVDAVSQVWGYQMMGSGPHDYVMGFRNARGRKQYSRAKNPGIRTALKALDGNYSWESSAGQRNGGRCIRARFCGARVRWVNETLRCLKAFVSAVPIRRGAFPSFSTMRTALA